MNIPLPLPIHFLEVLLSMIDAELAGASYNKNGLRVM